MKALRVLPALALLLWVAGCGDPYEKGMEAYAEGRWKDAIFHFEHVSSLNERGPEARLMISRTYFQWGMEAFEREEWDRAIRRLVKVASEDAENYEEARRLVSCSNFFIGRDAYKEQDYDRALRYLAIVRRTCSHYEESRRLMSQARAALDAENKG